MKPIVVLLVGLVCAVFTQFIAYACAGLGEGWCTPFLFSLAGFVAFPATLYAMAVKSVGILAALVTLGIILDIVIYRGTVAEGFEYFHKTEAFAWLWICCWASWQLAAIASLLSDVFLNRGAHERA